MSIDIPVWFIGRTRSNAARRGIEWQLSVDELSDLLEQQQGRCALSGLPIELTPTPRGRPTASIDRLDCLQGYVPGNVQWVHRDVNAMRQDMSVEYFAFMCSAVAARQQGQPVPTFVGNGPTRQRREASVGNGGPAPLGYDRDKQGGLVVSDESAATVRRIFEQRASGATLAAIAAGLNADEVPTARGGKWWPATVRYVLDNPKYRGDVEYLFSWSGAETHVMRPGNHEAIV